ncbi:DUF3040 domain-containing protein [Pseudonocardia nantongensis]|uniref:DUF3040 domain-containing protein n=1 Tax=Pseudonocardia nantongensis TaxID=1181885 RepID=UPI00397D29EE
MFVPPPPPPSTPPPGGPDPEPRPHAVPLNRSEERTLSGLENDLRRSDPGLDTEMSALNAAGAGSGWDALGRGTADRVLQAVAIGVIVLVLLPGEWLAAVLSFGLLLGVPFAMAMVAARARREAGYGEHGPGEHGTDEQGPTDPGAAGPDSDGDDSGGCRRNP